MSKEPPLPDDADVASEQQLMRSTDRRRRGWRSRPWHTLERRLRRRHARAWTRRRPPAIRTEPIADDISVVVYLDTDDEATIKEVLGRVDLVRTLAGYGGDERNVSVQRGSIFRRSWAAVRRGLSRADARERLARMERAAELVALGRHQAAFDQAEANAVSSLIASTKDISRVCIRVGSVLFLKYPSPDGEPVIVVRALTQDEIRAFEQFPEIQRKPEQVLQDLTMLLDVMRGIYTNSTSPPGGMATAQ